MNDVLLRLKARKAFRVLKDNKRVTSHTVYISIKKNKPTAKTLKDLNM